MATVGICLVPAGESDADFSDIRGETVIGVGEDTDYQIVYTNNDYNDETKYPNMNMSISYTAKLVDDSGETISSGVSPSSGSLDSGVPETLTTNTPDDAGTYKLVVEYKVEVTYTVTDEDGDETEEEITPEVPADEFRIKVVNPITLSVTLTNNSDNSLNGYGVYFVIDGERADDGYKTISLDANGQTTVTYKWITDQSSGAHTFALVAADGGNMVDIEGLGEEHTFYLGDNSYTWLVTLLVVVIILLIVIMAWVYRKPVKNFGKPKSRR